MALGDGTRLRRMESFVTPLLEPDERIEVVIPLAQTGSPKVRFVLALLGGLLGQVIATNIFRLKTYGLVVTDRRLLIVQKSNWTGKPKGLDGAIALDPPISAEFDDTGPFRELQLSRLRGYDTDYLNVWVPKRYVDSLSRLRQLVQHAA